MSVARMLEDFSKTDTFPVDVNLVLDEIRSRGVKDEILFFHDMQLDGRTIKGFLKRDEILRDGEKFFRSVITYGKSDHAEERLICCKELLHVLDPENKRAATLEEVTHLITKIGLPADLVDPIDGDSVWNDRIAILEAIAILFPLKARNILYDKYMSGRISAEWIADQAELPIGYIRYAMNGGWPKLVDRLIYRRHVEEGRKITEKIERKRAARRVRHISKPRGTRIK